MPEKDTVLINDNLFQQTISCPLKFYHIVEGDPSRRASRPLFRQRNKLHVRDAIAYQFANCRHTSNSTEAAFQETETWLKEDSVAICGAVVKVENLLTRIPILLKDGNTFTIIQVHGKLRKRSDGDEIRSTSRSRSIARYLLKAAYRMEVLSRRFQDHKINVHFYFPNKYFKASIDDLHLFSQKKFKDNKLLKQEFSELFSKVEATQGAEDFRLKIPELVAHKSFKNLTVSDAIRLMLKQDEHSLTQVNIERHAGCKYCEFRLPDQKEQKGCWDRFFSKEQIKHPEKHVYELIGQGNGELTEQGIFYREEADHSRGIQSFEDMQTYGGPTITILQRRNLQVLQAKEEQIPSLWIKPGVKVLESLEYPFHFIDFEAATYALPMKRDSRPYSSVYFQFSCHTLYKNGNLVYTEFLDQKAGDVFPHKEFANRLGRIPDIFKGTIMQYSPFEKQGVNRLIGDFRKEPDQYKKQIEILEEIRKSELQGTENRFFDLSRLIRDYYFNKYFADSLGLKQVLLSILKWEESFDQFKIPGIQKTESMTDITSHFDMVNIADPYKDIQSDRFLISDGSAAMNSWLALKNGLLTNEEKELLPEILKKYCALDSFALVIIYKHFERFLKTIGDEDLIKI